MRRRETEAYKDTEERRSGGGGVSTLNTVFIYESPTSHMWFHITLTNYFVAKSVTAVVVDHISIFHYKGVLMTCVSILTSLIHNNKSQHGHLSSREADEMITLSSTTAIKHLTC